MTGPERTLRDEIAAALHTASCDAHDCAYGPRQVDYQQADAVLPVVQARIDAARADTAEAIAQAIEENAARVQGAYADGLWRAARIARQHAATEGPRP